MNLHSRLVMPWTWFIKWNTDFILFKDIFCCCMLKMFTWTLCMREPHNIGPTNFESRTRVSFYIRLKPSTPKAAFPLARGLCDGRTDGFLSFVGACAATFWKHRRRSAISSVGRPSSTLSRLSLARLSTRVKREGPSGTVLVSMLRQTQGGIGVERSSSRALQTIRGETASAEETLSPLLPSLIDCTNRS